MSLCKLSVPLGGTQGYNVNNLDKGALEKIKYQMSKAYAF